MNIGVSFQISIFIFFEYIPRSITAELYDCLFLVYRAIFVQFSTVAMENSTEIYIPNSIQ